MGRARYHTSGKGDWLVSVAASWRISWPPLSCSGYFYGEIRIRLRWQGGSELALLSSGEGMKLPPSDAQNEKGAAAFVRAHTGWCCGISDHEFSLQPPSAIPVDLLSKEMCSLRLPPTCDLPPGLPRCLGTLEGYTIMPHSLEGHHCASRKEMDFYQHLSFAGKKVRKTMEVYI